jgi:hypothetical protein
VREKNFEGVTITVAELAQAFTDMGWNLGEGRARRLFGKVLERRPDPEVFTETEIKAALDRMGYVNHGLAGKIVGAIRELQETREP